MKRSRNTSFFRAAVLAAVAIVPLTAQSPSPRHGWVFGGRAIPGAHGQPAVQVVGAVADVQILGSAATTTVTLELHNPASRPEEAALLLPVPEGAVVSGFAFDGSGEHAARVLPRDEARRLYDEITSRMRDPALLEFVDWRCLCTSLFPVPAGGMQRVRVTYEHVLPCEGDRVDYVLPRTELSEHAMPWRISVSLRAEAALGLVWSPTHELAIDRRGTNTAKGRAIESGRGVPGPFRLCYTTSADTSRPTAALYAYPDPTIGGGYFLLLARSPSAPRDASLRREVTIVIDRSGSMSGKKLEQARNAALQVIEGLAPGEGIQVLDYGNAVAAAFAAPVAKDASTLAVARAHLESIRPHGGTNIHDALIEALRPAPMPGTIPVVLFLTDGLPTVGRTREQDIRAVVETGNPHRRRVFCFGVGNDVNVPLLDRVADATRARTAYVLPDEDIEVAVARTFARLDRPALAEPVLSCVDGQGASRIVEVLPRTLPDLHDGDQLVVLGQYRGEHDLRFELAGLGATGPRRFGFTLPVRTASTRHSFVPRLWASRQIAFLVDELRQRGGELGGPPRVAGVAPFADPRFRELREEIMRLSTRFGVLGEYTAFLATEGTDLSDWSGIVANCAANIDERAVAVRTGQGAVNQGCNLWAQRTQERLNPFNAYLTPDMKVAETTVVQQICDRAFFRRGDRWIDGNSVARRRVEPDERIEIGSSRFTALLARLEGEGRAGVLALSGEILVDVAGRNVLVVPAAPKSETPVPVEIVR